MENSLLDRAGGRAARGAAPSKRNTLLGAAGSAVLLLAAAGVWGALGPGRAATPGADAQLCSVVSEVGLRAPVIVASGLASLDGGDWLASSPSGISIPATVPGEIVSDLHAARRIGDPLFELNFKRDAPLFDDEWTFTKRTSAGRALLRGARAPLCTNDTGAGAEGEPSLFLVLESVKMAADVSWNGRTLARSTSQFVRAVLPVGPPPGGHTVAGAEDEVSVAFLPSALELSRGRFMACSGGWDWAPYSPTYEGPDHTFSRGIVGSAYLLALRAHSLALTDVVPLVRLRGPSPAAPLEEGAHAGFAVEVRVFGFGGDGGAPIRGTLGVRGSWGAAASARLQLNASALLAPGGLVGTVELPAPAAAVRLWWPLGMGGQPLYTVTATWTPAHAEPCARASASAAGCAAGAVCASRRIGFRAVALATHGFPPPSAAPPGASGSAGMLLVVNGRPLVARGANVIPPDEMEGRWSAEGLRALVRSAASAHMNCLRVWGGGAYLPPAFYEAADEHGVLILHDLMFSTTTQTHEPHGTQLEREEVAGAVRARSHHPSIVAWVGCNECDPLAQPLYVSEVMGTVAAEDDSRPVWPASPSSGWAAGVHAHSSLPNGEPLRAKPLAPAAGTYAIEEHGPYLHGSGWPAVNQVPVREGSRLPVLARFDPRIPLPLPAEPSARAPVGFGSNGSFVSEFGASAMSSFRSHAPTLARAHWGVHGGAPPANCTAPDRTTPFWLDCAAADPRGGGQNAMSERNYPCDALLASYFALSAAELDAAGEAPFRAQLYLCSLAQALALHAEVFSQRSVNVLGSLLWQLNEIWPTGGWGTLEYAASGAARSATAGQLLGGRWKPAHHWLRQHLFAELFATCGLGGVCYARTDAARPANVTVLLAAHALGACAADGAEAAPPARTDSLALRLPAGPAVEWFSLPGSLLAGLRPEEHFLTVAVAAAGRAALSEHALLLVPPPRLAPLQLARIDVRVGDAARACDAEAYGAGISGAAALPRWCVPVVLRASCAALFVTLSAAVDGHFSRNCLPLPAGEERLVQFASDGDAPPDIAALRSSLTVDHLAAHYAGRQAVQ